MSTPSEQREALINMFAIPYEGVGANKTCEFSERYPHQHLRATELAEIIFPDDPPPKQQTFNIHQQFAEGTDSDQVAQSIRDNLERLVEPKPRIAEVFEDAHKRQAQQRIWLEQLCVWFELSGKHKSARYIRKHHPYFRKP